MNDIIITIPGEPKGKGRPRFTKRGFTYTPRSTADYEKKVRFCTQESLPIGYELTDMALKVQILAYFPIPKSFSKQKQRDAIACKLLPTVKPDSDNIAKIILDSLNGLAFLDDKQVTELYVYKAYDDNPRVVIRLSEANKESHQ
jgi:hypothetical protein